MPAPEAALAYHRAQSRHAESVSILARWQWRGMSEDWDASWAAIVARLLLIVTAGQLGAARRAARMVEEQLGDGPELNVGRFAGVASDGRPLDSLLYGAVVRARTTPATDRLDVGGRWLDTLVRTQVADADRAAAGVAVAARPNAGYHRLVSPPCCQRCAVLAGRFFRWNAGFARHPKCDCKHWPAREDSPAGWSADISPDQVKDLTAAQRQAVSDGADLNRVINAHRQGRRSKDGMTTAEGGRGRLTPEGIYRAAAGDRDRAVQLLRRHGYLM